MSLPLGYLALRYCQSQWSKTWRYLRTDIHWLSQYQYDAHPVHFRSGRRSDVNLKQVSHRRPFSDSSNTVTREGIEIIVEPSKRLEVATTWLRAVECGSRRITPVGKYMEFIQDTIEPSHDRVHCHDTNMHKIHQNEFIRPNDKENYLNLCRSITDFCRESLETRLCCFQ